LGKEKGNLIPKARSRRYGVLLMVESFLEPHTLSTYSIKLVFFNDFIMPWMVYCQN